MKKIKIISASTLGCAEQVAEYLAIDLKNTDFSTEVIHGPLFLKVDKKEVLLFVCSTHGSGDLPDNIVPLYKDLRTRKPDLSSITFGAIGIGNREYDTFCGGIDKLIKRLIYYGAKQLGNTLKINILDKSSPEESAKSWLRAWKKLVS